VEAIEGLSLLFMFMCTSTGVLGSIFTGSPFRELGD